MSEAADLVAVDVGVSHTEVELVLVNCESVGFERELAEDDRVAVYPEFEAFDVTPLVRVRERALRETRFVADARTWAASRARRGRSCAALAAMRRCAIETATVAPRLAPGVRERHERFTACDACGRVFWEGSHWRRMRERVDALLVQAL